MSYGSIEVAVEGRIRAQIDWPGFCDATSANPISGGHMRKRTVSAFFIAAVLALIAAPHLSADAAEQPSIAQSSDDDDSSSRVWQDGLQKLNQTLKCKNRCQRESFSCMAACPNGNHGASCRGQCILESNNCSQSCDD
jgi:hypothetical protein